MNHGYKIGRYIKQTPSFSSYLSIRKRSQKIRISENFGSIIFVVGKSPMDIMEPILYRKKVPYDL